MRERKVLVDATMPSCQSVYKYGASVSDSPSSTRSPSSPHHHDPLHPLRPPAELPGPLLPQTRHQEGGEARVPGLVLQTVQPQLSLSSEFCPYDGMSCVVFTKSI